MKRGSSESVPVDENRLKVYLGLGATDADLAAMLDISERTLRRRYGKAMRKYRAERRARVQEMVWKEAKDGSNSVLVWLAKHVLQQSEQPAPAPRRPRKHFDHQRFIEEFKRLHDTDSKAGARSAETDGTG